MAENIIDQIIAAAHHDGKKLLSEAQQTQESDLEQKMSGLKHETEELLQRGRSQIDEVSQQELSTTRLELRRKLQTEKRRLLDQIYETAWNEITEVENYHAWLEQQLSTYARSNDQIIVSAHEHGLFENTFSDLLTAYGVELSDEVGRFRAGFIIDRGVTRLNCSLDSEFLVLALEAEIEISSILFSSD